MKKLLFCRITTLLIVSICLFSCSTNEGEKENDGSNNTTDVSVTGNVIEVGVTYAQIEGYVNLNQVTSSYTNQQIGVELSFNEDFKSTNKFTTKELEGNRIRIFAKGLDALTKYYYRTFVYINNLYYYGEKRSFTTKDFSNITTAGDAYDLTSSSAKINCTIDINSIDIKNSFSLGVAYSISKDDLHPDNYNNLNRYSLNISNISNTNNTNNNTFTVNISNLQNTTTYYYCSYTKAGSKCKFGEIKSFITNNNSVVDDSDKEWQEWYEAFKAEVAASHGPYAGYLYFQADATSEKVDSIAAEWDIANDSLMVLRNVPTRLFVQKLPESQSSLKEAISALNTVDVRVKIIYNMYYKSPLLFHVYPEPVTMNIIVDGQPKTAVVNFMNFETANQSYGQVMVSDGRCAVNVFLENIVVDKSIIKAYSNYDYVYLNWFGRRR